MNRKLATSCPKWKANLLEMGFSAQNVSAATGECTTLRRAVEWLCAQDASGMTESTEQVLGQQQNNDLAQSDHVEIAKAQKQVEQTTSNNQTAASEPKASNQKLPTPVPSRLVAKATRTRFKILIEMGFPPDRVESAVQECSTLRRAVEWLCSQKQDETSPRGTADTGASHQTSGAGGEKLQGSPGSDSLSKIASPQQKLQDEDMVLLEALSCASNASNTPIASPLRKRRIMAAEPVDMSPLITPMASPQDQCQNPFMQGFDKGAIEMIAMSSQGLQASERTTSRRTSLSSLLQVPADVWTSDQTHAAFKQLQSLATFVGKSPLLILTRRRLTFKQPCPPTAPWRRWRRMRLYYKQPSSAFPLVRTWKRMRLRFKQPPSAFSKFSTSACSGPGAPTGQGSVAPATSKKGGKFPKSFAKWKALLLQMGFPAAQIDANLRKFRSLRKAIDVLCS